MCVCVFPERQNHARELVREADLSQWDALVIMSGDGLLFEVRPWCPAAPQSHIHRAEIGHSIRREHTL